MILIQCWYLFKCCAVLVSHNKIVIKFFFGSDKPQGLKLLFLLFESRAKHTWDYQLVGNSIIALIFIARVSNVCNTFKNLSIKEGRKEGRKFVLFVTLRSPKS